MLIFKKMFVYAYQKDKVFETNQIQKLLDQKDENNALNTLKNILNIFHKE